MHKEGGRVGSRACELMRMQKDKGESQSHLSSGWPVGHDMYGGGEGGGGLACGNREGSRLGADWREKRGCGSGGMCHMQPRAGMELG